MSNSKSTGSTKSGSSSQTSQSVPEKALDHVVETTVKVATDVIGSLSPFKK